MSHADELFERTQARLEALARHRREVRNERPEERTRRQWHRAEEVARSLGSTRRSVVRAMLALVIADEAPDPKGDPPAPVAPGARAALQPKKARPKAQSKIPPLQNATPETSDQLGFWE